MTVLSYIEDKIGKPVVKVRGIEVDGKCVAMAKDGSVYEVTVDVKQVYKP